MKTTSSTLTREQEREREATQAWHDLGDAYLEAMEEIYWENVRR